MSTLSALHRLHLLSGARSERNAVSRARTQTVQWTVCAWRGAGPLARRGLQGHAAACNALSTRASSESLSLSAMVVWPCSSTSTPLRVSSFINRVMILSNTVCSASSLGAGTSTKTGEPSVLCR